MKAKKFWGLLLCGLMIIGMLGPLAKTAQAATGITIGQNKTVQKTLDPAQVTYTVTLTGASTNVTLRGKDTWINCTKKGAKYDVTVTSNSSGKTRDGSIVFGEGTKTWTLKIKQYAFTASTSKVTFTTPKANSSTVTTNYDGYCCGTSASWITVTKTSAKNFKVSVTMNPTNGKRTGTFTLLYGGAKKVITVEQAANALYIYGSYTKESYAQHNLTISASTPAGVLSDVKSSASWLKVVSWSGTTINLQCAYNGGSYRTATLTVKCGNLTATTRIVQLGSIINVATQELNLHPGSYEGDTYKNFVHNYSSTYSWVSSSTKWCACFASYCAYYAGLIDNTGVKAMTVNPTCFEIVNWLSGQNRYIAKKDATTSNIKPGMLVFYDRRTGGAAGTPDATGYADHVGIIISVSGENITMIEGNMTYGTDSNGKKISCIKKVSTTIKASNVLGYGNILP